MSKFDKSLDKVVNQIVDDLFDFDRHFYFFNRDEKDMHPYDVVRKSNSIVITHNVLGIEKEDLKKDGFANVKQNRLFLLFY